MKRCLFLAAAFGAVVSGVCAAPIASATSSGSAAITGYAVARAAHSLEGAFDSFVRSLAESSVGTVDTTKRGMMLIFR